ncbi:MAG TPA: segregation/condensation protein A [Verrucomicrobiae bacterium]|nr:segregation/condensation protein A [Verrucomicrobiae bacterium]
MSEYKVQFEVFEGPLDLLLYLVKKEEVDICQVNLTKIATQFIEYIELMRELDLEVAGEFLVMASTLMYIKSRELLPLDQQVLAEGEEEEEDPRWDLIRQLVEYKKFKDAAAQLHQRETEQGKIFPRLPGKLEFEPSGPPPRPEVSLFDLINAVSNVLKRFQQREGGRDIFEDKWTVSEKIELLRQAVAAWPALRFSELFEQSTSRTEVVVTFLALLELIRLKHVVVSQPTPFSEIEIRRATTAVVAAGVPPAVEGGILLPGTASAFSKPVETPSDHPPGGTLGSTSGKMPAATTDIPRPS